MSIARLVYRSVVAVIRRFRPGANGRARAAVVLALAATVAVMASCSKAEPPPPPPPPPPPGTDAAPPTTGAEPPPTTGAETPPPPPPPPPSAGPERPPTGARPPAPAPPTFSLPAPTASSWVELPAGLCASGTVDTLGVVADGLRQAIARAGVSPYSFYLLAEPDSGFVMVTRLEHTLADGRPAPAASRFPTGSLSSGPVEPTPLSWVRSLVTATPGYYRTVLFVVTPSPVRMAGRGLTQSEADSLLGHGAAGLPRWQASTVLSGVRCTALIYEIEKRNAVDPARVVMPGRLPPDAHLLAAGYWTASEWRRQ